MTRVITVFGVQRPACEKKGRGGVDFVCARDHSALVSFISACLSLRFPLAPPHLGLSRAADTVVVACNC